MPEPITVTYGEGVLLPSLTIDWWDGAAPNASLVDFSVAHTWELKISRTDAGPIVVPAKTSGITGAATSPNVTIDWAAGDLGALSEGTYWVQLTATRSSDSKKRRCPRKIRLVIEAAS